MNNMSQAKKITKFQQGGGVTKSKPQYQFMYNNELVSMDADEFRSGYVNFLNANKGATRNENDWNKEFTDIEAKILEGQKTGNYFNFDVGVGDQGARTIAVNSNMSFDSNADKGLNKKGEVAKPGLFSNVTGVKNEAARNSLLYGHMGQWIAQAKGKQDKQAALDLEKAKQQEELEKNKVREENNKFYNNFLSTGMNIPYGIFGPQVGVEGDALNQMYLERYWADPSKQGDYHRAYINKLRSQIGDTRYDNDDFRKLFKEKTNLDWDAFKNNLTTAQLNDPNFDFQSFYDSIGLGGQYYNMNDKRIWDEYQKQRSQQSTVTGTPGYDTTKGLYFGPDGNLITEGLNEEGLYIRDGKLGSGLYQDKLYDKGKLYSGDYEGLRYKLGIPLSGYEIDNAFDIYTGDLSDYLYSDADEIPFYLKGKKSSLPQFLLNPANESDPLYSEGHKLLSTMYDRYSTQWGNDSNIHEELNPNRNPYPEGEKPNNILSSVELTGAFTLTAPGKDNIAPAALIFEKLDGLDRFGNPLVQFRYIDEQGKSHVGRLKRKANGQVHFISDKGQSFNLGKEKGQQAQTDRQIQYKYKRGVHQGILPKGRNPLIKEGTQMANAKFKLGGILKAQQGMALYNIQADNKGVNTGQEYDLGTVLGDTGYKMTGADYAQLAALAADVGSLTAAFIPGANVAAATAGGVGSVTNYIAEGTKTGSWGGGNLAGLGLNLALDSASLLPIVGGGAKAAKIARFVKKGAPFLTMTFGALGLKDAVNAVSSIANGDYSAQNFRLLASGLTAALYGKRQATDRLLGTTKGSFSVNLKDKSGNLKTLNLTESQRVKLNELEGPAKTKFVKDLADAAGLKDIDLEYTKGNLKTINPTKWFGKDNIDTSSTTRLKTKGETENEILGWFSERAAKRLALNNPRMEGADRFMGGWTAVKNPLALSGANKAMPVEKKGVSWNPWSMTYFRKKEQFKGMNKADATNLANKQGKVPFPKSGLAPGTNEPFKPTQMSPLPQAGTTRPQFSSADITRPNADVQSNVNTVPSSGQTIITPPMVSALPPRSALGTPIPARSLLGPRSVFGASTPFQVHPNRTDLKTTKKGLTVGQTQYEKSSRNTNTYITKGKDKVTIGKGSVTQLRKQLFGAKDATKIQSVNIVDKTGNPTKKGMQIYQNIQKIKNPVLKKQAQQMFDNVIKQVKSKKGDGVFKLEQGGKIKKFQSSGVLSKSLTTLPEVKINKRLGTMYNEPLMGFKANPFSYSTKLPEVKPTLNLVNNFKPVEKPQILSGTNVGAWGQFRNNIDLSGITVNPTNISEFGRMLFNRSISKNLKNPHTNIALLSNPNEVYTTVKGDLLTKMATIDKGNDLRLAASMPISSDNAVQQAMQLNANSKATDFELQGAIANRDVALQQEAQKTAEQREYNNIRTETANNNNQSMAARDQAVQMFENQRNVSMGESVNNFWQNQNMRSYLNQDRQKGITDRLAQLNARQSSFGENAPVNSWKNQTIDQVNQSLVNEMNQLQTQLQANPNDVNLQNRYSSLLEQSRLLGLESEKLMLNSLLNAPKAGNIRLFSSNKKANPNTAGLFRRGGRVEYAERKSLLNHAFNLRNEAEWVRNYNQFIKAKLSADAKRAVASERSINEIVKIALNKK